MNASSRPLCELNRPRLSAVGSLLISAMIAIQSVVQCGCVALNIPSQRHHDPSDNGGILGAWEDPARPGRLLKEIIVGPPAETPLDGCDGVYHEANTNSFDGDFGNGFEADAPPTPEVPWPKYHPVPTRPVFGG